MKYRLEGVITDDTLIIKLISIANEGERVGLVESEIEIPLEALTPQGRADPRIRKVERTPFV